MSKYTEAVARNTEGLDALSTGICPGCEECRTSWDYVPDEDWTIEDPDEPAWYCRAVPRHQAKMFATEDEAEDECKRLFEVHWSDGTVCDEPSFSGSGCDICGSNLAGDLEVYHWVDGETNEIQHGFGACVDCVVYLANGDEPESWGDA